MQLKEWDFVLWLHILLRILVEVEILNTILQKSKNTLWEAIESIKQCMEHFKALRSEESFRYLWDTSKEFSETHNIEMKYENNEELRTSTKKSKRRPKEYEDSIITGITRILNMEDECDSTEL